MYYMTNILQKCRRLIYTSAGNYMFQVNNRNTRTRREICSKLTIKYNKYNKITYFTPCSSVFIVNFEQVNAGWVLLPEKWINERKKK